MLIFTIWAGKIIRLLSRLKGGGGSALPGYVVGRLNPYFLKQTLDKLPQGVIVVTGTNGKTSTTKIISGLLSAHGLRVLTNRSGGNFVRGIISTIIQRIKWTGELPYDIAVFEQDEAYAVQFVHQYRPRGVVALNVGRDQMDRFGEIDKTANLIGQVVAAAKDWVVLNANDPRIAALKPDKSIKTRWFGHDRRLAGNFVVDDQHHAGQKAKFFQAAKPDVCLYGVKPGEVYLNVKEEPYVFKTALDGTQNALNVAAALATLLAAHPEASTDTVAVALAAAQPAFGRGERIVLKNGSHLRLQLVKNPSSFNHNLRHLADQKYGVVGIAINDDYADGRDVSWLWDVDFSPLSKQPSTILCGGARAYDMAVRLQYQGRNFDGVTTSLPKFLQLVLSADQSGTQGVIFCTYTAMLRLRRMLKPHATQMDKEGL